MTGDGREVGPPFDTPPSPGLGGIVWAGGSPLAATVSVLVSHWSLVPAEGMVQDERARVGFGGFHPDYWTASTWEYGLRVGIFRILEVLDRHRISATFALDSTVCRRCPEMISQLRETGHEMAAHGVAGTELHSSRLDTATEQDRIATARAVVAEVSGEWPLGWYSPGRGYSADTARLVAANQFKYVCDWPNDDRPYLLRTDPPLVSLPRSVEFDDLEALHVHRLTPDDLVTRVGRATHRMAEEAVPGSLLNLSVNPWLSGQPHHIRYFDQICAALAADDRVWLARARDLAEWATPSLL